MDANLHEDLVDGKAMTATLHLVNGTPINRNAKKQATVDSAMYGSEFVGARTAVDQIIDLRATLCIWAFLSDLKSFIFGDSSLW